MTDDLITRLRAFVVERGKIACGSDIVSACNNSALSLSDLRDLLAALEAAREDAERYRWLRSRVGWMRPGDEAPWTTPSGIYLVATMVSAVYGNCDEQTDAAIDAAREARNG